MEKEKLFYDLHKTIKDIGLDENNLGTLRGNNRSIESTWRTQPIYTQRIVTTIVFGPLAMVDNYRRQCIEIKITGGRR